jgi:hypothetical protein
MRMQAVRPSDLSLLYRGLLDGGGRAGRPLSRSTVDAVHAVLRKAFNDAVTGEQIVGVEPTSAGEAAAVGSGSGRRDVDAGAAGEVS